MKKKQIKTRKPKAIVNRKPSHQEKEEVKRNDVAVKARNKAEAFFGDDFWVAKQIEPVAATPKLYTALSFLKLSDEQVIENLNLWQSNKALLPITDCDKKETTNLFVYTLVRAVDRLISNEQGFVPEQNYSQQYLRIVLPLHLTIKGDGTWCSLKFNFADKEKLSNMECHSQLIHVDGELNQKKHAYNDAHNYRSELYRLEKFHFATLMVNESLNKLYSAIQDFLHKWNSSKK
jgi:hypothetical protein